MVLPLVGVSAECHAVRHARTGLSGDQRRSPQLSGPFRAFPETSEDLRPCALRPSRAGLRRGQGQARSWDPAAKRAELRLAPGSQVHVGDIVAAWALWAGFDLKTALLLRLWIFGIDLIHVGLPVVTAHDERVIATQGKLPA